jgi:hypothetical protein
MKVNYSKKGAKWQLVFVVENIDPAGMSIAGNFNEWNNKAAKSTFSKSTNELKASLPSDVNYLSFKLFDNVNDCWCEVYDNGELYAGLEPFFVRNEMGTINIVIPLLEEPAAAPAKKAVAKKPAEKEVVKKAAAKKAPKKA